MMMRPPTTAAAARAARALRGLPTVSRRGANLQAPHHHCAPSHSAWIGTVPSRSDAARLPAPPPRRRAWSQPTCAHDGCGSMGCRFILRGDPSISRAAEFKGSYPRYRGLATQSETKPGGEEEGQGPVEVEAPDSTSVTISDDSEPVSLEIPGSQTGGRKLAIVFTCDVCQTRSAKQFTERSYLHGVVIVRCPGCQNLHLIADRLGYFDDGDGSGDWDLNKIAALRGESIRAVADGDVIEALSLEDLLGPDKAQELQDQLQHVQPSDDTSSPTSSK